MTDKSNNEKPPDDAGKKPKSGDSGISSSALAEDALKSLNLQDLLAAKPPTDKEPKKMENHKFWQTQPVLKFDETSADEDGPIEPDNLEKVPKEPYPLLPGFEWVTPDLGDPAEIEDIYQLLYHNYVEDDEAMFRFKYSAPFLNWALKSPGWTPEWHVGIRASVSRKLVAFISGVPVTLKVRSKLIKCAEINFMCVHKKLRSKRLAPVLIREVTRRCNLVGVWQAIYTGGILLPTPVSTCRYFHRSLNWKKLYEVGFSPLPPGSTLNRQILKYKLPERTATTGLRPMELKDIPRVLDLLKRYLNKHHLAQEFSEDEGKHWLLNSNSSESEKVIFSFVVEKDNAITDFFSFFRLESTVIGNEKHKSINAAYLYYYATDTGMDATAAGNANLKKRLNQLINDALILAKNENFDVMNALTLMDNPFFLKDQKFGPGDGRLHYYLFNYRTSPIPGGIDEDSNLDEKRMGGVGVVML